MDLRRLIPHFVLGTSIALAAPLAACGGGGEGAQGPGPNVPTPTPSATDTAPTPGPTGSATTSTPPEPPKAGAMKPIAPSTLVGELKEIGLDPKALPPLDKLEPDKLRKVMNTFKKALGTNCTGCHDGNNMKAPTPNKKVAKKMWADFTRALAREDGGALYCDSCHQGEMHFLDRHDVKAVQAWMDTNMVSQLKRRDGKEHSCETCHGDPFEPKILDAWAK